MKVHANHAILALPRPDYPSYGLPSSSWIRVVRDYPDIPGAVIAWTTACQIQPGDRISCGTACSEWEGTVVPWKEIVRLYGDRAGELPPDTDEITYVCIAAHELAENKWNHAHWAPGFEHADGHPVIGECALNAWPGGDVSVVRTLCCRRGWDDGYFCGSAGQARSCAEYRELRSAERIDGKWKSIDTASDMTTGRAVCDCGAIAVVSVQTGWGTNGPACVCVCRQCEEQLREEESLRGDARAS